MTDQDTARRVLAAIENTAARGTAVLVGSSSLLGFKTSVPALTEDIDLCVPDVMVESFGDVIVQALAHQGYKHETGTATFTSVDGVTFDLLGHGDPSVGDRIAGHGALRVMVFEDLCMVLADQRSVQVISSGGMVLRPSAFVAIKLLTERANKGTKDKLQALLVLAEHAEDEPFMRHLLALLSKVDGARIDDVRASSVEAYLALGRDPQFSDAGAEGYFQSYSDVRLGLEKLQVLLQSLDE